MGRKSTFAIGVDFFQTQFKIVLVISGRRHVIVEFDVVQSHISHRVEAGTNVYRVLPISTARPSACKRQTLREGMLINKPATSSRRTTKPVASAVVRLAQARSSSGN